MKKNIIFILFLGVILFFGYQYVYQDHRDIENENPDFVNTADAIFNNFSKDKKQFEASYLDKTIEISGIVTELNTEYITLNSKIFCKFLNQIPTININDQVIIKGRCIGYDDLLEQVKLDQCRLID